MTRTFDTENKKPNLDGWANCLILLVPATGVELVTYRLQGGCSTN
jgi:hypothetical protein